MNECQKRLVAHIIKPKIEGQNRFSADINYIACP